MGKAIGSIEKHKICVDTPNESAIKERVQAVKDAWHASVKALKSAKAPSEPKTVVKRPIENPAPSPSSAKKIKTDEPKKASSSSFSSLLKKVSSTSSSSFAKVVAEGNQDNKVGALSKGLQNGVPKPPLTKKTSKRVKWADHFGGTLTASVVIEGDGGETVAPASANDVNWSDRKKRDRMREKELLAKAK